METLRHSQMRAASRTYYHTHASDIIKHKTLLKIRQCGRVPRESTLAKHGFDQRSVEQELMWFASTHPDTKASKRIVSQRARAEVGCNEKCEPIPPSPASPPIHA